MMFPRPPVSHKICGREVLPLPQYAFGLPPGIIALYDCAPQLFSRLLSRLRTCILRPLFLKGGWSRVKKTCREHATPERLSEGARGQFATIYFSAFLTPTGVCVPFGADVPRPRGPCAGLNAS